MIFFLFFLLFYLMDLVLYDWMIGYCFMMDGFLLVDGFNYVLRT